LTKLFLAVFHGSGFVKKIHDGRCIDHGGRFAYTRLGGKGNHSRGDEYSIGYPAHKLFWYRGGMQDWENLRLTTVKPESE